MKTERKAHLLTWNGLRKKRSPRRWSGSGQGQTEEKAVFSETSSGRTPCCWVSARPHMFFLQDVAKALHTESVLSEYSGVCNALGALLGDVLRV